MLFFIVGIIILLKSWVYINDFDVEIVMNINFRDILLFHQHIIVTLFFNYLYFIIYGLQKLLYN